MRISGIILFLALVCTGLNSFGQTDPAKKDTTIFGLALPPGITKDSTSFKIETLTVQGMLQLEKNKNGKKHHPAPGRLHPQLYHRRIDPNPREQLYTEE